MFGNTIDLSARALDLVWVRQQATTANIANVDTPGYKKKDINFEETFRRRLQAANKTADSQIMKQAIRGTRYEIYMRDDTTRVDENNVNIDVEQTKLVRSTLQYQYLLQSVTSDVKRLQTAIKVQA